MKTKITDILEIRDFKDLHKVPISNSARQLFLDAYDRGYAVNTDVSILTSNIKNEYFHEDARLLLGCIIGQQITVWYCRDSDGNQRCLGDFDIGEGLDKIISKCIELANTCPECKKHIGAKNMLNYGFADFACKDCKDEAYKKFTRLAGDNWWN